jgi:glycosyltransferase involved in cell wall biosynthesis
LRRQNHVALNALSARGPLRTTLTRRTAISGGHAAINYSEAAAVIRRSGLFDEKFYALSGQARAAGEDPAVHYVRIGEARRYMPSRHFDPAFYKEANPDIAVLGEQVNCLHHYICYGKAEGRTPLPIADRIDLPTKRLDPNRKTILVIAHEASRTGAPILALNIGRTLSKRLNVVIVLVHGGPIEDAFKEFAAAVIKPPDAGWFHPADAKYLVKRLVETYRPLYAVANSVETRGFVPPLARACVPVIALVHEFSGYTRPIGVLDNVYGWVAAVVFATTLVADSSRADYPILAARKVALLPQGPCTLPPENARPKIKVTPAGPRRLRPDDFGGGLLIVGMGGVYLRKGVDLFIAVAADVRRLAPKAKFRFAWVGPGYEPKTDIQYSVYLREQIERSEIGDAIVFVDEVSDLDPIYAESDLFLLSSRLDPLPNVAIDAILRGIPVICFEKATGLAEILARDVATSDLVVPYFDTAAAARLIVHLMQDRPRLRALSQAVKVTGQAIFNMERYAGAIDALGQKAASDWAQIERDRRVILNYDAFDSALYLGNAVSSGELSALTDYLVQSHLLQPKCKTIPDVYLRRPLAGFHPLVYACECPTYKSDTREDPLAHFLQAGRPAGPWTHPVIFSGSLSGERKNPALRVALHGHFHYLELLPDLLRRLGVNKLKCDLFLTTTEPAKMKLLRDAARKYRQGSVNVSLVPNRGRDVGAFFTHLRQTLQAGYDVVGHIHGKRSPVGSDSQMGEAWREFLWEHLVGSKFPMADIIVERFASEPSLGMVFPEDPNLVGWDKNREEAEKLAARMKFRQQLPTHFDFPVGTMFWARPEALKPIFDLALSWEEYPPEPITRDGTVLHAIERLLTFVAANAGYHYATTRVVGSMR